MAGGSVKQILYSSCFEKAKGLRSCRRNKDNHKIGKDEYCLSIKSGLNYKYYCLQCARIILEKGQKELNSLIEELSRLEK